MWYERASNIWERPGNSPIDPSRTWDRSTFQKVCSYRVDNALHNLYWYRAGGSLQPHGQADEFQPTVTGSIVFTSELILLLSS